MATATASSSRNASADNVPTTIEGILTAIKNTQDPSTLVTTLRSVGNEDAQVRETLFSSFLQGGQDPLSVLDIKQHTAGILFLL